MCHRKRDFKPRNSNQCSHKFALEIRSTCSHAQIIIIKNNGLAKFLISPNLISCTILSTKNSSPHIAVSQRAQSVIDYRVRRQQNGRAFILERTHFAHRCITSTDVGVTNLLRPCRPSRRPGGDQVPQKFQRRFCLGLTDWRKPARQSRVSARQWGCSIRPWPCGRTRRQTRLRWRNRASPE